MADKIKEMAMEYLEIKKEYERFEKEYGTESCLESGLTGMMYELEAEIGLN